MKRLVTSYAVKMLRTNKTIQETHDKTEQTYTLCCDSISVFKKREKPYPYAVSCSRFHDCHKNLCIWYIYNPCVLQLNQLKPNIYIFHENISSCYGQNFWRPVSLKSLHNCTQNPDISQSLKNVIITLHLAVLKTKYP